VGKKGIKKIVEFTPTGNRHIVNLGFGNLLPDGGWDDRAISDNGDMLKILATVIKIVTAFSGKFPFLTIVFTGSTPERTNMYNRILTTYYTEFTKDFVITGLIEQGAHLIEVEYEPLGFKNYLFFLIKRKT